MNPWNLLLLSIGWVLVGGLYLGVAVGLVILGVTIRLRIGDMLAARPEPEEQPSTPSAGALDVRDQ